MYQLVSAFGILRDAEGKEQPVTIDNLPLSRIFAEYSSIYAVVTTTTDPTQVALDLYKLPYQVRFMNTTLQHWFSTIGSASLQTEPLPEGPRQAFVRFWNLHQEDFDIALANRGIHPSVELEADQQIDVCLQKPNAHYENIVKYGLGTINGFLHRLDHNENGAYIVEGGTSRRHSDRYRVGLLDFQHIGALDTIPITESMIYKRRAEQPYSEVAYIELPEPIGQKQVLVVIAGWLHALGRDYSVVSDTVIKINLNNYPWFKRFVQTKDWLDLSALNLTPLPNGAWLQSDLNADTTMVKWLTLPQSFVVLVDTPELTVGFSELQSTQLPGRYYSSVKPDYPVIVGDGRLAEPLVTFEGKQWVIAVDNAFQDRMVLETTAWQTSDAVSYRRQSNQPFEYAQAKFLYLSKLLE